MAHHLQPAVGRRSDQWSVGPHVDASAAPLPVPLASLLYSSSFNGVFILSIDPPDDWQPALGGPSVDESVCRLR